MLLVFEWNGDAKLWFAPVLRKRDNRPTELGIVNRWFETKNETDRTNGRGFGVSEHFQDQSKFNSTMGCHYLDGFCPCAPAKLDVKMTTDHEIKQMPKVIPRQYKAFAAKRMKKPSPWPQGTIQRQPELINLFSFGPVRPN